jgi:hypothetical protein
MTSIASSRYQVGGALPQDVSSYVTRESDRQLLEALKAINVVGNILPHYMGRNQKIKPFFTRHRHICVSICVSLTGTLRKLARPRRMWSSA